MDKGHSSSSLINCLACSYENVTYLPPLSEDLSLYSSGKCEKQNEVTLVVPFQPSRTSLIVEWFPSFPFLVYPEASHSLSHCPLVADQLLEQQLTLREIESWCIEAQQSIFLKRSTLSLQSMSNTQQYNSLQTHHPHAFRIHSYNIVND